MTKLDWSVLDIDYQQEADRIAQRLRDITARELHKRGLVVAISGGIDSSCSIALAVRALGAERVFALILPERDSSDDSGVRARILAEHLGVRVEAVDIAPALAAIGCYSERDAAVRAQLPNTAMAGVSRSSSTAASKVASIAYGSSRFSPTAKMSIARSASAIPEIVAATNFKQRIARHEYYHADRPYAVVGTPNRSSTTRASSSRRRRISRLKPIAHLYKTQVYGMARFLGRRARLRGDPTTDNLQLEQGQDESISRCRTRDGLALWALN